jgi:hypothetical protein
MGAWLDLAAIRRLRPHGGAHDDRTAALIDRHPVPGLGVIEQALAVGAFIPSACKDARWTARPQLPADSAPARAPLHALRPAANITAVRIT